MSVAVLDFNTIISFVEDEEAFHRSIKDRFALLDTDNDGLLSYTEMLTEMRLRVFEAHDGIDAKVDSIDLSSIYNSIFGMFDHDSNGIVDFGEFLEETKEMMLAMVNGLGSLPVQMVLEEGSFLKKAVDRELAKTANFI